MNAPLSHASALLALDGILPEGDFVRRIRDSYSTIIAADGAALKLEQMGIMPDVIIGDFDTVGDARKRFEQAGATLVVDIDQQRNDFEKALEWIVSQGHASVNIIGIGGGLTDHALNNFSVAAKFAPRIRMRLIEPECTTYIVSDGIRVDTAPGARVSLIPLPRARLSADGLRWPLHDEWLEIGVREGASNRATAPTVSVDVFEGVVAVFVY